MFSFRTTPLEEQLDRSLRDGKVAVMEGDAAWDVERGGYTSDIFRERGNLVQVRDWSDPRELTGLDAIVVDVQDCGGRYFEPLRRVMSLIGLLTRMDADARRSQEDEYVRCPSLYVVDHPNPAGRHVEGSMPPDSSGDVDLRAPHRYGLTIGELCHLHYSDLGGRFALHIISAAAQSGSRLLLPWSIPPADDMPGMFTPMLYPGHALWRWTSATPGLGTARPYEMFGAPFFSHSDSKLPCPEGVSMRPCGFVPAAGRYAGEACIGWQVLLLPGAQYHSLLHTLQLVRHFLDRYSAFTLEEEFWRRLSDPVMEAYVRGEITFDIVEENVKSEEQKWIRKAKRFVLYEDPPCRIK